MTRQKTLVLCILLTTLAVSCRSSSDDIGDRYVRDVSYQEFIGDRSTRVFAGHDFVDFSRVIVDHDLQQLIVGVRNNLLRLRASNLRLLEQVDWTTDNATVAMCIAKGQTTDECHNFIRVLMLHDNLVFACGTNSYAPQCSWRKRRLLGDVVSWVRGAAKCPYGPSQNASYVMTKDGNYYSATVADFAGRDAAVYRSMGPSRPLRTVQYNSRWLNDPDFVSSYDVDDYVYFFFRETAIEYINCGKIVYSRVARVCKKDAGGKVLLQDNWTTFFKARLNCSLPGQFPFYYNELQSTFLLRKQRIIYAVFTTPSTSVYGSAVCVYNLTAFDVAFDGPFKYREDSRSAWTRLPNSAPVKCDAARRRSTVTSDHMSSQRHLVHVQKFQLMDSAVQPSRHWPAIVADGQRFNHIVVDRVQTTVGSVRRVMDVVFLSALEGVVHKYVILRPASTSAVAHSEACLMERITITHSRQTIASLTLDERNGALLVGTSSQLYRFPVRLCHRLKTREQCIGQQDPYCSWNDRQHKCSARGNPHLYSCTQLTRRLTAEGDWSEWSSWQRCAVPASETTMSCQCRSRTCHQLTSQRHRQTCRGDAVQVINCTTEATAGSSGQWAVWSEWSSCSGYCGHGQQTRRRSCVAGHLTVADEQCSGQHQQTRTCPPDDCKEVRRHSSWSEWLETSVVDVQGRRQQRRLRCTCRALVGDSRRVRRPRLHAQSRHCHTSSSGLQHCDNSSTSDSHIYSVQRAEDKLTATSSTTPSSPPNIPVSSSDHKLDESTCPSQCIPVNSSHRSPNTKNSQLRRNNVNRMTSPSASTPSQSRAVATAWHHNKRDPFTGFCRCRDLGLLRVCQRCPQRKTSSTTV